MSTACNGGFFTIIGHKLMDPNVMAGIFQENNEREPISRYSYIVRCLNLDASLL